MVNGFFFFFLNKDIGEKKNCSSQEDLQQVNVFDQGFDNQENHNLYKKENFTTTTYQDFSGLGASVDVVTFAKITTSTFISKKNK